MRFYSELLTPSRLVWTLSLSLVAVVDDVQHGFGIKGAEMIEQVLDVLLLPAFHLSLMDLFFCRLNFPISGMLTDSHVEIPQYREADSG